MGYDDSLDAFGVHGIGGIIGAISAGIVASPGLGGTGVWDYVANGVAEFNMATQVTSQPFKASMLVGQHRIRPNLAYSRTPI